MCHATCDIFYFTSFRLRHRVILSMASTTHKNLRTGNVFILLLSPCPLWAMVISLVKLLSAEHLLCFSYLVLW